MTNYIKMLLLPVIALTLFSCTVEEPDYREHDYGYVQFKLYKEASYEPQSKADGKVLDRLSDATKVKVEFTDGVNMLSQTLVLNAYDEAYAEFGLRSDKIKLLAGTYEIISFTLFGKLDEQIYEASPASNPDMKSEFTVVPGGLSVHDLLAKAVERGFVKFTLVKDTSAFVQTKASQKTREYTFDEIKSVDIMVRNGQDRTTLLKNLPVKFSLHFLENDDTELILFQHFPAKDTLGWEQQFLQMFDQVHSSFPCSRSFSPE